MLALGSYLTERSIRVILSLRSGGSRGMEVWGGRRNISLTEVAGVSRALERLLLLLSRGLGWLRWVDVGRKAVLCVGMMGSLILLDLLGKVLEML